MEVIGAANALGATGMTSRLADELIAMTEKMPPYYPSMKQDFDHGRPMEIEYLYSRPIALAAEAGFAMPRLSGLEAELKLVCRGLLGHAHC